MPTHAALANMTGVPATTLLNIPLELKNGDCNWKIALMPAPRSSVPLNPKLLLATILLSYATVEPPFVPLIHRTPPPTVPDKVTFDWECARFVVTRSAVARCIFVFIRSPNHAFLKCSYFMRTGMFPSGDRRTSPRV
ncbi:hypothetical protein AWB81_07140 [Caballeronia arationis]|nr:hypothetical protein AWB81_07140 [Caballeronia arationis]